MASLRSIVWRIQIPRGPSCGPFNNQKFYSTAAATWHTQTAHPSSRVQIYTSRSHDPYLNLSAEHFLLQNSHPESFILFLYVNDPCVVIGRNQNPWLETNLGLLSSSSAEGRRHGPAHDHGRREHPSSSPPPPLADVQLVRRRSGGGAVFHDRGNVNYSVICPPAAFDRNKHADMVVRALRSLGVPTARVNERHDIVVVGGGGPDGGGGGRGSSTFKVSGSAYKLTRLRSLHHGTCLLSSPNLADIGRYLRSPAEPYIKARGVESVRSPIRNVGVGAAAFTRAVMSEFRAMYGAPDLEVEFDGAGGGFAHEQIQKGYRELVSPEWVYNQTPLFTFSTHPSEEDPRERPQAPEGVPEDFHATIKARHGQVQQVDISDFNNSLIEGQDIRGVTDWRQVLRNGGQTASDAVGSWFNHLFGIKDNSGQ